MPLKFWKKESHDDTDLVWYTDEESNQRDPRNIYCPHPLTNWGLNPSYVSRAGTKLHTIEGFRKTTNHDSVVESVNSEPDAIRILCLGGSTTYCIGVETFDGPWPDQLARKLNGAGIKRFHVVNGGVGGWGTPQSLTRLVTWAPFLRPNLLIVYQSKNDLTPFYYTGHSNKDRVYPDLGNVMGQLSGAAFASAKGKLHGQSLADALITQNKGLSLVFGDAKPDARGLERFGHEHLQGTELRYEAFALISQSIKMQVLFLPEIIIGSPYAPYVKQINETMRNTAAKHFNCHYFDIEKVMPRQEAFFQDKMHLTESGCEIFGELVARYLTSQTWLPGL